MGLLADKLFLPALRLAPRFWDIYSLGKSLETVVLISKLCHPSPPIHSVFIIVPDEGEAPPEFWSNFRHHNLHQDLSQILRGKMHFVISVSDSQMGKVTYIYWNWFSKRIFQCQCSRKTFEFVPKYAKTLQFTKEEEKFKDTEGQFSQILAAVNCQPIYLLIFLNVCEHVHLGKYITASTHAMAFLWSSCQFSPSSRNARIIINDEIIQLQ